MTTCSIEINSPMGRPRRAPWRRRPGIRRLKLLLDLGEGKRSKLQLTPLVFERT
jgi:hypothetical protein